MEWSSVVDRLSAFVTIAGFVFAIGRFLIRRRIVGRFRTAQQEVRRLTALFGAVRDAREDALERELALATSASLEMRGWVLGVAGMTFLGLGLLSSELAAIPTRAPVLGVIVAITPYAFLVLGLWACRVADIVMTRGNDIRMAFLGTTRVAEDVMERLARMQHRHRVLAPDIQRCRLLLAETRRPGGVSWSWDGKISEELSVTTAGSDPRRLASREVEASNPVSA